MNLRQARELAAQIYCEPDHASKILDPNLCESIARLLVRETEAVRTKKIEVNASAITKIIANIVTTSPQLTITDPDLIVNKIVQAFVEDTGDNKSQAPES